MNCDATQMLDGCARSEFDVGTPGIAVFLIAETAIEAGLKGTLLELLEDQGHETLLVIDLDASQAAAVHEFDAGRERAAAAVVAIDLLPMPSDFAAFDNLKIPKALERARHLADSLGMRSLEPLTATRTSDEAWRAVRLLLPGREAKLRAQAKRMREEFASSGAVRDLTREGRRAKVELVQFNGELAIRKTYRRAAMRYMEREIEVLERLSPTRPELPKLLDRGPKHIVLSYIDDGLDLSLEHRGGPPAPLPLKVVRQLAAFIKACVDAGFDPIDIRAPGNVILTGEGLKVIDFELWRRSSPGTRPEDALCLTGVPAGDLERPRGVPAFSKSYADAWYPLTLLSPESFLHDPAWLQQLKRGANLLRLWGARAVPAARSRVRQRVRAPTRHNPRYIPADLGVDGVIAELNRRKVRYVVLRWFERLPDLPSANDLDLLVHDDDIAEVDRVLVSDRGIAECDVYSVTGRPGTAYSGVPHLLPHKATSLLDSAKLFNGMYKAPTLEDHFLSLAFHAVYHKGFKSALPSRHEPPAGIRAARNDYLGTLTRLAAELGVHVDLTLEGLDRYLAACGWRATPEMLRALARRNVWIGAEFGGQIEQEGVTASSAVRPRSRQ